MVTTKSRETIVPFRDDYSTPSGTYVSSANAGLGWQQITSSSHPYWLLGKSDADIGGSFTSLKWSSSAMPAKIALGGGLTPGDEGWKSRGVLVPNLVFELTRGATYNSVGTVTSFLNAPIDSKSRMEADGTTAIARSIPTSPVFDGATAVAELYSGIPSLPGNFVGRSPGSLPKGATRQGVAGDYLNYQFAIAPTVSDVRSLRRAAQESEKILAQLERDSGRTVRRTYEFPSETRSVTDGYQRFAPRYMGGYTPTAYEVDAFGGTVTMSSTYTTTRRFSGAFTYHLPEKGTWRRKIADLDAVYGVRPGIDTAWNLVPFSWMADWYGNMGDVLTNLQAFALDGNVLKYGYITSRTERLIRFTGSNTVRRSGGGGATSEYPFHWEMKFVSHQRYPANPFGFGLSGGALTPRRVAILAALGLGRG